MTAPAIIMGGADLLGGLIGRSGQSSANETNLRIARDQMRFQERMSSTAYQRAVADMRSAGLNPALAYQQGGASSPAGASTRVENAGAPLAHGVSSAGSAVAQAASVQQARAQTDNINAQTEQLRLESAARVLRLQEEVANLRARTSLSSAQQANQEIGHKFLSDTFDDRARSVRFGAETQKLNQDFLTQTLGQRVEQEWLRRDFARDTLAARIAQIGADLQLTNHQARNAGLTGQLLGYDLNAARNESNAQDTWFKRSVSPYLGDAKTVVDILSSLRGRPASEFTTNYHFSRYR